MPLYDWDGESPQGPGAARLDVDRDGVNGGGSNIDWKISMWSLNIALRFSTRPSATTESASMALEQILSESGQQEKKTTCLFSGEACF
jgi:hypothetical protein